MKLRTALALVCVGLLCAEYAVAQRGGGRGGAGGGQAPPEIMPRTDKETMIISLPEEWYASSPLTDENKTDSYLFPIGQDHSDWTESLRQEALARMAEVENIVGVKESSGDLQQIATVVALCPDDFCVVSGDDALTLPLMAVGGKGVISTTANVAPREMIELVRAFRSGDPAGALAIHQRLLPLFEALFCETNPIPVKAALALMGLITPEIRLPLLDMTETNRERLQVVIKELGLL